MLFMGKALDPSMSITWHVLVQRQVSHSAPMIQTPLNVCILKMPVLSAAWEEVSYLAIRQYNTSSVSIIIMQHIPQMSWPLLLATHPLPLAGACLQSSTLLSSITGQYNQHFMSILYHYYYQRQFWHLGCTVAVMHLIWTLAYRQLTMPLSVQLLVHSRHSLPIRVV